MAPTFVLALILPAVRQVVLQFLLKTQIHMAAGLLLTIVLSSLDLEPLVILLWSLIVIFKLMQLFKT